MLDEELLARLGAVIARIALPVDDDACELLDRLVHAAVARMQHDDPGGLRIDDAVQALRALVDDMTQQVRILRLDAIHPIVVVGALERGCPPWPFGR